MKSLNVSKDKQLTLDAIQEKCKIWDINNSRAKKYHYPIGEMISVDLEQFSLVEDLGFNGLLNNVCSNYRVPSNKYIRDNIVTDIHQKVNNILQQEINSTKFISFTSDGWTATTTNTSFLSLTGHWIDDNFDQNTFVLRVVSFPSAHTAANISKCLEDTMTEFKISFEKIHLLVRDNAVHMVAGVAQLVISDAISDQRCVKDLLSTCKQIVGYFNHSPSDFVKYIEYQKKFNLPLHKFIQDVFTQWNNHHYLLERIQKQKTAVMDDCSDNVKSPCLENNEWKILEKVIVALKPFIDCTNILSDPNAKIKEKYSQKDEKDNQTSNQMKKELEEINAEIKVEMDLYKASRLIKMKIIV
ncbi:zinc finger BED domain-containing protein 4-like [Lepeophtheirus salmonis]|uniref:zinc finger BED domain-containing protein 4-like n=1 Tax=Lepeophtheirus salmonis TaxID=72036 RepID=UPI001AEAD94E|nr:zinc finger BED domain-containing protein 4-like [Lepeophtheirus salmonis]